MNKPSISRKQIVTALVAIVVLISLLFAMHVLVNSLDLFSFIRSIHGG